MKVFIVIVVALAIGIALLDFLLAWLLVILFQRL